MLEFFLHTHETRLAESRESQPLETKTTALTRDSSNQRRMNYGRKSKGSSQSKLREEFVFSFG